MVYFRIQEKTVLMTVRSHWKCASGVVGDEIDGVQSLIKTFLLQMNSKTTSLPPHQFRAPLRKCAPPPSTPSYKAPLANNAAATSNNGAPHAESSAADAPPVAAEHSRVLQGCVVVSNVGS